MALALRSPELARDTESLNVIANQVNFGLWRTDQYGFFTDVNHTFANLFGLDRSTIEGQKWSCLKDRFGKDWKRDVKYQIDQMFAGQSGDFTTEFTLPDGTSKYIRVTYFPISSSEYMGSLGMVYDETKDRSFLDRLYQLKGGLSDA